jgi:tRNA A-37 threonylcarbamoyl transferase component Bud32
LGSGGPDPLLGAVIAGKYRLEALAGAGGMGRVYKATHLGLDKTVCVKLLKPALLADETVVARFEREAKAASRLEHPHSIDVKDFGQDENGQLYLVMEYVQGSDLRKLLKAEFPLPVERVVRIVGQVLSVLARAHELGVIHRDLKPENILLAERPGELDFVKVVDFGIAKLQEPGARGLTQADMVCGTPEYMSPEQALGREVDARADLYAVGVILHQCFAGKLPFEGRSTLEVLQKQTTQPPRPVTDAHPEALCPPALEELILRALSKDPARRPQTAERFRRELFEAAGVVDGAPPRVTPPPAPVMPVSDEPTLETIEGPGRVKWIVLAAALAAVGVLAWRRPAPAPATPPEATAGAPDAGTPEPQGLTKQAAFEIIESHHDQVQKCFDRARRKIANTQGEMTLSISIGEDGAVQQANVSESTIDLPKLEGCVEEKARGWKFPRPTRPPMMLSYTYKFRRH